MKGVTRLLNKLLHTLFHHKQMIFLQVLKNFKAFIHMNGIIGNVFTKIKCQCAGYLFPSLSPTPNRCSSHEHEDRHHCFCMCIWSSLDTSALSLSLTTWVFKAVDLPWPTLLSRRGKFRWAALWWWKNEKPWPQAHKSVEICYPWLDHLFSLFFLSPPCSLSHEEMLLHLFCVIEEGDAAEAPQPQVRGRIQPQLLCCSPIMNKRDKIKRCSVCHVPQPWKALWPEEQFKEIHEDQ